jgi:peptidyl-tRNA hydrolase
MPKTPQLQTMFKPDLDFRYKQCLIIRNDVKMSCGKRCAQAAHASIGAYNNADKVLQKAWLSALGLGPAKTEELDKITGMLTLL